MFLISWNENFYLNYEMLFIKRCNKLWFKKYWKFFILSDFVWFKVFLKELWVFLYFFMLISIKRKEKLNVEYFIYVEIR